MAKEKQKDSEKFSGVPEELKFIGPVDEIKIVKRESENENRRDNQTGSFQSD